ncbi:MAG: diguanylate cyclase [Pseudomonadota bacterium]
MQRLLAIMVSGDFRQRRRLLMVLMTAFVYAICIAMLYYGVAIGIVERGPAGLLALLCALTPSIFFIIVRGGHNLRFSQPSLALPQAVIAQTLIAIAYAVTGPVHGATLILLAVVMVFVMFEMGTGRVWTLMFYTIGLMGAVMSWRAYVAPAMYPARLELIHFALTATSLPAISSLSVQLWNMRKRLRVQKVELEAALEHIRTVATHDELTGLANRRHMLALLAEHIVRHARGGPGFMIALADIDHFKRVNDSFGHRVGDEALVRFAEQARAHLRATDIVARWGGEEFLLLLPESPCGDPNIGIERLRGALAVAQVSLQAPHLRVAFSTGVTRYVDGEAIDDLIERADQALYRAKGNGRNRTVVM